MLVRRREGFDVVLASPYAYGGGITQTSLVRTFLSHMANGLVKELLGIHGILTMSSVRPALPAPILARLQARHGPGIVDSRGFECVGRAVAKARGRPRDDLRGRDAARRLAARGPEQDADPAHDPRLPAVVAQSQARSRLRHSTAGPALVSMSRSRSIRPRGARRA